MGWIISPCPYYFFEFLAFCCGIVLMFWNMGGTVCLAKFVFLKMVYVWWIARHLKFTFPDHFDINMTLSWLKSLFMLIFFYIFLFENLWGGCFTCKIPTMYNVLSFFRNTGKHDMCSGQTSDICLMLHLQIILFIEAAWWMEFNCSIDIPILYITFNRQLDKDADDIVYWNSWTFLSL